MEVDQKDIPTRTWEDQLGYHCNNSGTAKGLKESSNRRRAEKLRVMVYIAWRKVAVKTDPLPVWGWSWNKEVSAREVNILDLCPFSPCLFLLFIFGSSRKFPKMQTTQKIYEYLFK